MTDEHKPDIEYRWLLGLTIVVALGLTLYLLRSWWLS
jgi:hypothetical protein